MKALERPHPGPACLAGFSAPARWSDLITAGHGRAVRQCLWQMQGGVCAYCEGIVPEETDGVRKGHAEHLWPRGRYPKRRFDWDNLFLSCDKPDHCGHYKDGHKNPERKTYDPADVLDPAREDPDALLRFYATGRVGPRDGLTERARRRAEATIRLLNLDDPALRQRRRGRMKVFTLTDPDIAELLDACTDAERAEYIRDALAALDDAQRPFSAVVRQFLRALLR